MVPGELPAQGRVLRAGRGRALPWSQRPARRGHEATSSLVPACRSLMSRCARARCSAARPPGRSPRTSASSISIAFWTLRTAPGVSPRFAGRAAEDLAHLLVRDGELEAQLGVLRLLAGKAVQVFERLGGDEPARGRGPGQVLDGVVELEEEGIRELPHVAEAALRARPLLFRPAGLPQGGGHAGDQRHGEQGGHGDRGPVPPRELAGAIAPGIGGRGDGPPAEVALEVVGQLLHRGIAPIGLLAQGLQRDPVQLPAQLRRRSASGATELGRTGASSAMARIRSASLRRAGPYGLCPHSSR